MSQRVKTRRARRTDLMAVLQVLAASGQPVPAPERATLRRFRRLVADLGSDTYVALEGGEIVGFVHVTYARQIATAARAHVDALVVAPHARRRGIGSALFELAVRRARKRGCHEVCCVAAAEDGAARGLLTHGGCRPGGDAFVLRLDAERC